MSKIDDEIHALKIRIEALEQRILTQPKLIIKKDYPFLKGCER